MQRSEQAQVIPSGEAETTAQGKGIYVYCVADAGESVSLGDTGIEGSEVYTIGYMDICAVVHNCPAEPYQSSDDGVVKAWVLMHQKVIDAAWEKWGTVLPLGFDTIITGQEGSDAEQNTRNWLKEDYESLKKKMEKVRGKAEYGVQVFWDPMVIAQNLTETSPEIKKLEEEIRSKSRGLAYMYRQKLENFLKKEMEVKADRCFKDFYSRIKKHVDDIRVEKTKKTDQDSQMIMNLSCLVYTDKYRELGGELDEINKMDCFSVRFTGPWPPYSFVSA